MATANAGSQGAPASPAGLHVAHQGSVRLINTYGVIYGTAVPQRPGLEQTLHAGCCTGTRHTQQYLLFPWVVYTERTSQLTAQTAQRVGRKGFLVCHYNPKRKKEKPHKPQIYVSCTPQRAKTPALHRAFLSTCFIVTKACR